MEWNFVLPPFALCFRREVAAYLRNREHYLLWKQQTIHNNMQNQSKKLPSFVYDMMYSWINIKGLSGQIVMAWKFIPQASFRKAILLRKFKNILNFINLFSIYERGGSAKEFNWLPRTFLFYD